MPKVIFSFAGTGDKAKNYAKAIEPPAFAKDVIRVYIDGCQHPEVGASKLNPDLKIAAKNIHSAFEEKEGAKMLNLQRLKDIFGSGIFITPAVNQDEIPIESIGLEGFSRGAVTTFAVAKALNELNLPIDIFANQPVPGTEAIYTTFEDLSTCQSIRSATTFITTPDLHNSAFENTFFQQMLARFPPKTAAQNILIPHQQHVEWQAHKLITHHRQNFFSTKGYALELQNQRQAFEPYLVQIITNRESLPQPMEEKILYLYAKEGKIFSSYIDPQGATFLDIDGDIAAPKPFIMQTFRSLKLRIPLIDSLIEITTPKRLENSLENYYQEKKELFFTPEIFRQDLYNSHGLTVEKDPSYLQSRREEALKLLNQQEITLDIELSDIQAQAIVALANIIPEANQAKPLYAAILTDSRFAELILSLDETLKYLAKSMEKKEGKISQLKTQAIKEEAREFKRAVILAAQDFLESKDESKLKQKLDQAEHQLESKALNIERDLFSKALCSIREILGKLTGLALFAQPIIPTQSSQIMKERLKGLRDLISQEPISANEPKDDKEVSNDTEPPQPEMN